jgi:hypothetical protein
MLNLFVLCTASLPAPIEPPPRTAQMEEWALKQVQGDEEVWVGVKDLRPRNALLD